MESKSLLRTFGIILFSAIVNTLCFVAILGLPMPQIFSSNRDPETVLQNMKQKEFTETANPEPQALNDIPIPVPEPVRVKPKKWKAARVKPVVKPTVKKLDVPPAEPRSKEDEPVKTAEKPVEHQPKVVDVNFDNSKKPEEAAQQPPKEESAPKPEQPTPEQVKREEMSDPAPDQSAENNKLIPVQDKVAGVQAATEDDSDTEADSPDVNPPQPEETQPAAVIDSSQ